MSSSRKFPISIIKTYDGRQEWPFWPLAMGQTLLHGAEFKLTFFKDTILHLLTRCKISYYRYWPGSTSRDQWYPWRSPTTGGLFFWVFRCFEAGLLQLLYINMVSVGFYSTYSILVLRYVKFNPRDFFLSKRRRTIFITALSFVYVACMYVHFSLQRWTPQKVTTQ